jgi:hypothetical protein
MLKTKQLRIFRIDPSVAYVTKNKGGRARGGGRWRNEVRRARTLCVKNYAGKELKGLLFSKLDAKLDVLAPRSEPAPPFLFLLLPNRPEAF